MKHLMGSALAYFLARLSAYQPARAAGSSTPPDELWVVGKRGGRSGGMRDLAAQVAEFVAIQCELAGASHDMLTSHFLGLVDDRHVDDGDEEDIDEGWADLRSTGVLGLSDQKKSEAASTTQPDVLKSEDDAAQSGQTAPAVSAGIVKIVKRVEKWILKNARNDFKRHKATLADVDNYRNVVMLPRDRVKLRNFIAPLCRLVLVRQTSFATSSPRRLVRALRRVSRARGAFPARVRLSITHTNHRTRTRTTAHAHAHAIMNVPGCCGRRTPFRRPCSRTCRRRGTWPCGAATGGASRSAASARAIRPCS